MQKKFLKDIMLVVVGKPTEGLVDLMYEKKDVNEFLIAKKLDLTINQVRNILYKLSDKGLVSSTRKKDKKKGWYTYFWTIEVLKSLEFWEKILAKKIEQFNNQIKSRETKRFYVCESCNIEFNEEHALAMDFICSECGNVFGLKDNAKLLKDYKKELEKSEQELKIIREEILKEREKIGKVREKERKKLVKEKSKKRKKKKAETDRGREKERKKSKIKTKKKIKRKPLKKKIKKSKHKFSKKLRKKKGKKKKRKK